MLLKCLNLQNFGCYEVLNEVRLNRLTVFIGENDAGKSMLLEALKYFITDLRPPEERYFKPEDGERAENFVITGLFELEDHDTLPNNWRSNDGKELKITKIYPIRGASRCELLGIGYVDARFNNFGTQNADEQRELLEGLGLIPGSNAKIRNNQFEDLVNQNRIPIHETVIQVPFSEILPYLPLFECISAIEYKDPDSLVHRTLNSVTNAFLRPINPETQRPELLGELTELQGRIHTAFTEKIIEMEATLRTYIPSIRSLRISEPSIDFARSVTPGNLLLDLGHGSRLIKSFGEGTKKKLWMGLLDWERHIQEQYDQMQVIRIYDEPDVNLDYSAEKKLFGNILDATSKKGSRTQALVATHSVTLIDRAPAQSINLICVQENGSREIECLCGDEDDDDIRQFLSTVGRTVGIPNSSLFYERVFLVVEGESEEHALPIIYRNLFGRSMIEDGIVLINLHTCGAWKSVLRILQRHKSELTFMLLDQDCNEIDSTAKVTEESLEEIGYPPDWRTNHCIYIGTKEFEDSFETKDFITIINQYWPKENGTLWQNEEIENLRAPAIKFSGELLCLIRTQCAKVNRNSVRKPEIALKLANHCGAEEQIPLKIIEFFNLARQII